LVLGPLLFLLYVNDLPSATDLLKVILFADDSNLILRGRNPGIISRLMTTELEKVSDWFSANKLLLNPEKNKTNCIYQQKMQKGPNCSTCHAKWRPPGTGTP
jgi:hypothetical protein